VKDVNGCVFTFRDTVGLFTIPTPTVTAFGPTNMCPNQSVMLSSSSATGNVWNNSVTTQSVIVTSSAPGLYWVTVSQYGCHINSDTVNVVVFQNPVVTVNSQTICIGGSTTLTAVVSPAGSAASYTWSPAAT
jgi:hypothetical protein